MAHLLVVIATVASAAAVLKSKTFDQSLSTVQLNRVLESGYKQQLGITLIKKKDLRHPRTF